MSHPSAAKSPVPIPARPADRSSKARHQAIGLAILLVEQHSAVALDFSPRTVVMNRGRIVYDGDSEKLRDDPALLESLVGVAGPGHAP